MQRNKSACLHRMKVQAFVISIIALAAATALVQQAFALGEEPETIQKEIVTVSCFKGNLDPGNRIGSITVTSPQTAAQICNSIYYDCQGKCLGCFIDSGGVQVCYDKDGRKI